VRTRFEFDFDTKATPDRVIELLAQTHCAFTVPGPGTSMEIHGEIGAIVSGDAMTPVDRVLDDFRCNRR